MKNKSADNGIIPLLDNIYLIFFALFIAMAFLNTTTFEIEWPVYLYNDLRALLFVVILLRIGYGCTYSKKEIIFIGIIGIVFFLCINRKGYDEFKNMFLLILGAKDIPLKKIIRVYFIVSASLLIITMFAALMGRIDNLFYYQGSRRRRIAMGIIYPTDFSAHVFFIILCYVFLRRENILYIELLGVFIAGLVVYWLTDARLNTVCILLISLVFTFHKWISNKSKKQGKIYKRNSLFSLFLALTPVFAATFMIILSAFYDSENKVMNFLNKIINNRFSQSHKAIKIYGFSLLGQSIPMQGYGGTTELPKHYFYLDSSYINIIMRYGILLLMCVLLIWIVISFRAREQNDLILLWIVTLISLQCMIEHHMIEIAYNPFIWGVLADTALTKRIPFRNKQKL